MGFCSRRFFQHLQQTTLLNSLLLHRLLLLNRRGVNSIAGSAMSLSAFGMLLGISQNLLAQPLMAQSLMGQSLIAQALPTCQPPRENQFLLLVLNQRSDTQTQLKQLLPASAVLTPCDYLSNSVVRVEGFSSADVANAWAKYINDRIGLQAFVARSANSAIVTTPSLAQSQVPTSFPAPTSTSTEGTPRPVPETYNPQPLGTGYAVLVNYFNRPEAAADVGQVTAGAVGLVAYNQNPYLLAIYTNSEASAASMLRTLSDRGFTAVMVDSRRVVLLKRNVAN